MYLNEVHSDEISSIFQLYQKQYNLCGREIRHLLAHNHITKPLFTISPHIALLHGWTLEGLPKYRGILGEGTADCGLWSLSTCTCCLTMSSSAPYCTWFMGCRIPSLPWDWTRRVGLKIRNGFVISGDLMHMKKCVLHCWQVCPFLHIYLFWYQVVHFRLASSSPLH